MSRKMKDSGIEWIGDIPDNWNIGYIGQIYTERKQKVSDRDFEPLSVTMNGIVPQLSTAAKTDAHDDRKLVKKGDFAINSRSDRRGSCGIAPMDGSISLINTVLKPKDKMNPDYYNWLFHTSMFSDEFYKWGHGIVNDLWTTNWTDMKTIAIPIPLINEQVAIADYLNVKCSYIDNIITKTQASIEEYKKLKQSIITQAVTQGVRGDREMKESGVEWIGQIPKNWDVTKISRIGITYSGATPLRSKESDYFEDATIRWVRTLDLNDWLVNDSSEKITDKALDNSSCTVMPVNTVCVAMYGGAGTIGKSGLLTKECATNQAICSIVCDSTRILPMYLLFYMIAIRKYWMIYAVGTRKDPNISQDIVNKMNVIVPPIKEQERIVVYLQSKCQIFDDIIQKKNKFVEEMEKYKQSVIYEYVTGKKEVS